MTSQIDTPPVPAQRSADTAQPWGFWATLGWTLLAAVVGFLVMIAAGILIFRLNPSLDARAIVSSGRNSVIMSSLLIMSYGVAIAMLFYAAKRAGWSATTYLGLVRPRGRYVLLALLCVALPFLFQFAIVQFDIRQIIAPEAFGRARGQNLLHAQFIVLVISSVIAAPILEEIVFRGFVYRGLSASRLGVAGTILITSLVWGLIHFDKSATGMISTVVHGVVWGWLRWYTGSTWVVIGSHMVNNAVSVLMLVAALYGFLG